MPEIIEISGMDYSQGLPTPDGAGDLGQQTQTLPGTLTPEQTQKLLSDEKSTAPFILEALMAIAMSVAIGGTMGAVFGRLFGGKWTLQSTARGAVIGGMITTIRAIRIGVSGRKDVSVLEIVI